MRVLIYWFRNDLRLIDNPAFTQACLAADALFPVYIHEFSNGELNEYGFKRVSHHRQEFVRQSLDQLRQQLRELGSDLLEYEGKPEVVLAELAKVMSAQAIYCEQIEAPQEIDQVAALQDLGIEVNEFWQSSMLSPQDLPFDLESMPDMFTQFRREVEAVKLRNAEPIPAPATCPPLPQSIDAIANKALASNSPSSAGTLYQGGEEAATLHLTRYLELRFPDSYKQTRNQLMGQDFSSKFSLWLASGCISARVIASELAAYETQFGANEGTYWLWFELLWRDYFRFIHFKYGKKLYRSQGLSKQTTKPLDSLRYRQWTSGSTGQPLIDAGMHELERTGYLSNRLRQVVASYWIYDMDGDWRAGAAWFEAQLIDYDVYSNQGNWLYIAGRGTDPRGGRPFNVVKQMRDHDPHGVYQQHWR